ncbi:DUF1311 domain-containing protein [Alcaligenaceae bacterium 429]|nr:DUF1311 domain-containing protein [Alcaligenaceae bacterium 429]
MIKRCFALLLLVPLAVYADDQVSTELRQCLDLKNPSGVTTRSHFNSCYTAELDRLDKELNVEYARAKNALETPEQVSYLIQSQRDWLKYRDSMCIFELYGPFAPGGPASQSACMVEMTDQKIKYLKLF